MAAGTVLLVVLGFSIGPVEPVSQNKPGYFLFTEKPGSSLLDLEEGRDPLEQDVYSRVLPGYTFEPNLRRCPYPP